MFQYVNVKSINKHMALDLVRFSMGGIARVELARELNLTRAAVTSIVNDLKDAELVREVGTHPSGRKPVVLEVNPSRGWVIGVDLGATHMTLILADCAGQVIREVETPLDIDAGPDICLPHVITQIMQVLSGAGLSISQVSAVGLGVPGPVVADLGLVSFPPIMPNWDNFPIRSHLMEKLGVPVVLGNDAELGALGEWAYGAGRGEEVLAYIKIGTGIGAGLLIDGKIFRGVTGTAGEIGHIMIDKNGPVCTCGNSGCLEAIAGGRAIARRAQDYVRKYQRSRLAEIKPVDRIRASDVIAAARRGDLVAQMIIKEVGESVGTALSSVVNLFNPSMIVVGGQVSQCGDLLLEPIRRVVQEKSLKVASRNVRIAAAFLGRRSSGMGAVVEALTIALHQFAEDN
jgi:glucokinase-like ROK family protein